MEFKHLPPLPFVYDVRIYALYPEIYFCDDKVYSIETGEETQLLMVGTYMSSYAYGAGISGHSGTSGVAGYEVRLWKRKRAEKTKKTCFSKKNLLYLRQNSKYANPRGIHQIKRPPIRNLNRRSL
jgi:hypothetical protein